MLFPSSLIVLVFKLASLLSTFNSYLLWYKIEVKFLFPYRYFENIFLLYWIYLSGFSSIPNSLRQFLITNRSTAAAAAATTKSLQSCLTLCDPIDSSPPGSSVPGILQAGILEWVAMSFSNAWTWKVKVKLLSRVRLFATVWTVAYQASPSMGFSRQEYWSGLPFPSPQIDLIFCQIFTYLL